MSEGVEENDVFLCQKAFMGLDEDLSGFISYCHLEEALNRVGLYPSFEEINKMITELDAENKGAIAFEAFLELYRSQKVQEGDSDDEDTLDAYVAVGGSEDKSGNVNASILINIIRDEFQLTIDIERLIKEVDDSANGLIEYDEFKTLLKTKKQTRSPSQSRGE
jgi:Ca2+-binding EF-hand superfamily protein